MKQSLPLNFASGLLLMLLHYTGAYASSPQNPERLKIAENKRIEASICADSMNRITVANDRITHIFGDEGTFESQNDEVTGQIFLKPTAENGSKNLSVTLITEQGVTQDLTLTPTSPSARTVILTHDGAPQASKAHPYGEEGKGFFQQSGFGPVKNNLDLPSHQGDPWPVQLLDLLKQAINGQLPVSEEDHSATPPSPEGYAITPVRSWQVGPYGIYAFTVENVTDSPLEFLEKDFYQSGDLALSFHTDTKTLVPQQETTLYVVRLRTGAPEGVEGRTGEP